MTTDSGKKPIVGWMTTPDFVMMTNEQPEGGFKWEFLDFNPKNDDRRDFNRPIFIYSERQNVTPCANCERLEGELRGTDEVLSEKYNEIQRLQKQLAMCKEALKNIGKGYGTALAIGSDGAVHLTRHPDPQEIARECLSKLNEWSGE